MKKTISLILVMFLLLSGCGKSSKLISPVDPSVDPGGIQTPIEPEVTTPSESGTKSEETTEQKPATNYWDYAWITTKVITATAAIVGVVYGIYKFADMLENANIPTVIDQTHVNDFENDISTSSPFATTDPEDQGWNSVVEENVPEVAGNKAEKNRIGTDNGMGLGHEGEATDKSTWFTTEELFENFNSPQPKPHKKDLVGYHSSEEWDVSTDSGGKKAITDADFFNLNSEEDELEPIIETTEIPIFTPDMMPRRRKQVAEQNKKLPPAEQNKKLPPAEQNKKLPPAEQNKKLPPAEQNKKLPPAEQNKKLPHPLYDSPQMTVYTYPQDKKTGRTLTTWAGHKDLDDSGDCIYIPDGSCTFEKKEIEAIKNLKKE